MNFKHLITAIIGLCGIAGYGQSRPKIETDSSIIEISKNSMYRVYTETYKNKDSVWISYHFRKDTTRLCTQGWRTKKGKYLGIWKEFNFEGQLLYARDYDNDTCEVNKNLYPFHDILEEMKLRADSLIISAYSDEFFDKHVRFDFDCAAYYRHKAKYKCCEDSMWTDDYAGSWTEPLSLKPNLFRFRYSVSLGENEWYPEMIGIVLDSTGKFVPSHDRWNNYGFEKVTSQKKNFELDKTKAMEIAKSHGLMATDESEVSGFLAWEKFNKAQFFTGQFRYYITELTGISDAVMKHGRSKVVHKYNVYTFNPWTCEFVEMKKMKNVHHWEGASGSSSGLIPDKD